MTPAELAAVPGVTVHAPGRVGLSGPALDLLEQIDAAIVAAAAPWSPDPVAAAPILDPADLRALDYFTSFPHLVMLPAAVANDDDARQRFRSANAQGAVPEDAPVAIGALAPIDTVLAPAACYCVYPFLRGCELNAPRAFSTLGFCFRNERHEEPLRRHRCFRMREIVHIGTAESCRAFGAAAEDLVTQLGARWRLPLGFEVATDPFFDPARSPRFLHQKLFPSKREALYGDGPPLAIASINLHRSFFGEAFGISVRGEPAHTACLAFGLERWLYAVLERRHSEASDRAETFDDTVADVQRHLRA